MGNNTVSLDRKKRRKARLITDSEMASLIKQFHQMKIEGSLAANEPQTIAEANEQL